MVLMLVEWEKVVDRDAVRAIFEEAFPASLRAPWVDVSNPRDDEELLIWQAREQPQGLVLIRRLGPTTATFVRYLAIDALLRGQGIGSAMWKALGARLRHAGATSILLDVEDPIGDPAHAEEHRRRISFYERLGVQILPTHDYRPPEHGSTGESVPLLLMGASLDGRELNSDACAEAVLRYRYGVH